MEFNTIEVTKERLINWQRAFKNHRHYRVTPSLEGRYRSPQCWDVKEVNANIDIIDALLVERVVVGLPVLNKAVLKYNYFTPYIPLQVFCRKINRMIANDYKTELERSIHMVDNLLRKKSLSL